ncbi:MAG: hypothetical protein ACK4S4_00535 [Pyrinomonadaceae bacterium]
MSQRNIFVYGLIFVAAALFLLRVWMVNTPVADETAAAPERTPLPAASLIDGEQIAIPIPAADPGWTAVGPGPLIISAKGTVDLGGGLRTEPDDKQRPGDERVQIPSLPYGTLIGRIGENGKPFRIGRSAQVAQKQTLYLAINDADHSDNSGEYLVTVKRGYKRTADEQP